MNRLILFLTLLLLWLVLGVWLSGKYLCKGKKEKAKTAAVAPVPATGKTCNTSFELADGTSFKYAGKKNVQFLKSGYEYLPFNDALNNGFNKISDYLKSHGSKVLQITGKYKSGETYSGMLSNLGAARATTVKKIFTEFGVPSKQISVAGEMDNDICFSGDTLSNGIAYSFVAASNNAERLAAIKKRLRGKPIILHFETGSEKLTLSDQQRQDFEDLAFYLDNVPGATLHIDGHTDNLGKDKVNKRLSRKRAETIRDKLVRNTGIDASRMRVKGYGKDKPIDTNKTSEGRAQNRRVEVILR